MASSRDWRRTATAEQIRSVTRVIDSSVARIARVHDYLLGGKDHFKADQIAGDEAIACFPDLAASVRNTRAFLGRAVRFLTAEQGVRQFLDIGTGFPTAANTHEVAQGIAPESKVVYVDNDPMVLAHARALLASSAEGECAYVDADIRDPEKIVKTAAEILDFTEPVGVVLTGILQFVPDGDNPYGIVRHLMRAVTTGSYLVISHPAADIQPAAMEGMASTLGELLGQSITLRGRDEVTAFFGGLDLVAPGVVRCPEWRPDRPEDAAGKSTMWGGVAEKPRGGRR